MFKGAKKEDLRLLVSEINITIDDKMIVTDLNNSIEDSNIYKNKPTFVTGIANIIIKNRKHEKQRQLF